MQEQVEPHPEPSSEQLPKMSVYHYQWFMFTLILTAYAALNNSEWSARSMWQVRSTRPFFAADSPVLDVYSGDLSTAFSRLRSVNCSSKLGVLFLYAPWDLQCRHARATLELVQRKLFAQVCVVAVNCWHQSGSCRQQLQRVARFPVIAVYYRHGKGIHYHGELNAHSLTQFIGSLWLPLVRLHSRAQLMRLLASHSSVVVGFSQFGSHPTPASYFHLLRGAILWRETEPLGDTAWAVVTSAREASTLQLGLPGSVTLYTWHHYKVLNASVDCADAVLNSSCIVDFVRNANVLGEIHRSDMAEQSNVLFAPPHWLPLANEKSNRLDLATRGPGLATLMVFGRRWASNSSLLRQVRRVWMQYHECDASHLASSVICQLNSQLTDSVAGVDSACCYGGYCLLSERRVCVMDLPWFTRQMSSVTCDSRPRSIWCADRPASCSVSPLSSLSSTSSVGRSIHSTRTALQSIHGLACQTNRTLNMILLDLDSYSQLLPRLLGSDTAPATPTAVIIQRSSDELFRMTGGGEEVNVNSLAAFVRDFTLGRLQRHLAVKMAAGHVTSASVDWAAVGDGHVTSGILELNTLTFQRAIHNVTQDTVVLFYREGCGYCGVLQHIMVTTWHLLCNCNVIFGRLDGASIDVPWSFTMRHAPTLLHFSPHQVGEVGPTESHVFPATMALSVNNLLRFIVQNSRAEVARCLLNNT